MKLFAFIGNGLVAAQNLNMTLIEGRQTRTIEELNSCEIGAHNCQANSDCKTQHTESHEVFYSCVCNDGFRLKRFNNSCVDIDECKKEKN